MTPPSQGAPLTERIPVVSIDPNIDIVAHFRKMAFAVDIDVLRQVQLIDAVVLRMDLPFQKSAFVGFVAVLGNTNDIKKYIETLEENCSKHLHKVLFDDDTFESIIVFTFHCSFIVLLIL